MTSPNLPEWAVKKAREALDAAWAETMRRLNAGESISIDQDAPSSAGSDRIVAVARALVEARREGARAGSDIRGRIAYVQNQIAIGSQGGFMASREELYRKHREEVGADWNGGGWPP